MPTRGVHRQHAPLYRLNADRLSCLRIHKNEGVLKPPTGERWYCFVTVPDAVEPCLRPPFEGVVWMNDEESSPTPMMVSH